MAKRPSKKQKKTNPLKVALKQLAEADEYSIEAVRDLGKALQLKAPKVPLKNCTFKVDGVTYSVRVTAYQREQILKAAKNGDVFGVVTGLTGNLNVQVLNAYNNVLPQLEQPSKPVSNIPQLGCCTCENGKIPNLSQAQCAQYSNSTWGPPPDCSDAKP